MNICQRRQIRRFQFSLRTRRLGEGKGVYGRGHLGGLGKKSVSTIWDRRSKRMRCGDGKGLSLREELFNDRILRWRYPKFARKR